MLRALPAGHLHKQVTRPSLGNLPFASGKRRENSSRRECALGGENLLVHPPIETRTQEWFMEKEYRTIQPSKYAGKISRDAVITTFRKLSENKQGSAVKQVAGSDLAQRRETKK